MKIYDSFRSALQSLVTNKLRSALTMLGVIIGVSSVIAMVAVGNGASAQVQAQILSLLEELQRRMGMAIMLVSHDLGVVAEAADQIAVMYAGRIVERASVARLFADPQHPYTVGLLGSIPRLDLDQLRLPAIEGLVPNPLEPIPGCRFHPRCPFAIERCRQDVPPLVAVVPEHSSACWRAPLDADVLVPI